MRTTNARYQIPSTIFFREGENIAYFCNRNHKQARKWKKKQKNPSTTRGSKTSA